MLKRLVAVCATLALVPALALAQANPRGKAEATLAGKSVTIDYGRPSLKGRDMVAQATVGMTWRMGADAATTLATQADLAFGEVVVPAGTYTLQAKLVAEGTWHLVASSEGSEAVEVPLTLSSLEEPVEKLTIELSEKDGKGRFELSWGGSSLSADFVAK